MKDLAALVAALALAGCAAEGPTPPSSSEPTQPPAALPREPPPKQGPQPILGADSAFEETAWGFVRKDFEPPASAVAIVLEIDTYEGASLPTPTHYVRVRDGAYLALHVRHERAYDSPRLLREIDGVWFAHASVRGTGCSGGAFNWIDESAALDGRELIEFLASEPWTTGNIGLYGGENSSPFALLAASEAPVSLRAVVLGSIWVDAYRDIMRPGGIHNSFFDAETGYPFVTGTYGVAGAAPQGDEVCAFNVGRRGAPDPARAPGWVAAEETDTDRYDAWSLDEPATKVRAPTLVTDSWQRQITGARGPVELFRALQPEPIEHAGGVVVPKVLVASNGIENTHEVVSAPEARAWFERFLLGRANGVLDEASVRMLFGVTIDWASETMSFSERIVRREWPPEDANWTRFHLDAEGRLAREAGPAGSASFVASARGAWVGNPGDHHAPLVDLRSVEGPDVLIFSSEPFDRARALAGPVAVTLNVSTNVPDADVFVILADEAQDGTVTVLQRGLLRASHRALDADRTLRSPAGETVRPYHTHVDPQAPRAGEVMELILEVRPVAHVFYPGHRARLEVSAPPTVDGTWSYEALPPGGVTTISFGPKQGSSVLLPFLDVPIGSADPGCGVAEGYVCVRPLGGLP